MDSQDHHNNTQQSPGGKSNGAHVCTKCGWNYPNPHPSAKNRRAHKKICGTIKGFEIVDSDKAKHNLDLQEEHCLDDEQKLQSPRVVEKANEKIGDISEEDVFADAVSEFSRSDSFKVKEETATNCPVKSTKNPGDTQLNNSSSTVCIMKSSEVVQESCEVPPVEVLDVPSSVEASSGNQQGGAPSTEGQQSMASETLNESSQEAQVINGGVDVGAETECKGKLPDESDSKVSFALGKREDTSTSSWNDEVIYSDLEGPDGFAFEATSMVHPGDADNIVSENTSSVEANAAQAISTSQSASDGKPFAENADVSLHGTKGPEGYESSHSVNPCFPETPEADTRTQAESLGRQPLALSIDSEVPSSDKLLLEDKTESQGQTASVAVKDFPSAENIVISKSDPEDNEMKDEEGGSSFSGSQETAESETLRASLPAVDSIVASSNADVSANKTGVLIDHESEVVQANVVSEGIMGFESPVSVVLEGDNASDQRKRSTKTSEDSILQISSEVCKSNDEALRGSSKGGLVEESSFKNVTNTKDDRISHSGSTGTTPEDSVKTADQKLLESGRTEFNRVVGGLGVIQANEIDGHVKAHNFYAEVPVTIESNDHRDLGRLQNLSETHIRSLVSSPLVTRNNTSNAFESNMKSVSGVSDGVNKPDNGSESSSLAVSQSKNQEITMEKTTSWGSAKEQHVPLKNLLSEARSPRLVAEAKKDHHESNIPRVSSILDQETSPEDARWPERGEVSEEWNSPAKYPVDLKREEKKVKGRPFWVPFVCCSSVK
ncbi:hypothetical protein EUTSA_v10024466mg [Eutrema salsugineum]|uniref:Uncharacterized protein n=1 Tax=Eutrema salsugineum TaxID=72664 RepID=V4MS43_EUTSA|nr:uncharacterized protein LOC18029181 [Eutrema salsugineum]ESQ56078.1 hypothetical protein EUTSA_v10024466mg [Eutrema salsugineum]